MGVFDKKEVCEYCKRGMKSTYRSKKFCSDKCRVYFNRDKHKLKFVNKVSQNLVEIKNDIVDSNKEQRENILALIELIENKPIPKERDTPNGRMYWKKEIDLKIATLKEKLKSLD